MHTEKTSIKRQTDNIDRAFKIGIIFKSIDGVIEVITGLILLFISPGTIKHSVSWLINHVLPKDPHNFLTSHVRAYGNHLSAPSVIFGGLYLLSHGIVSSYSCT
jgi:uncharacterized membrane protein